MTEESSKSPADRLGLSAATTPDSLKLSVSQGAAKQLLDAVGDLKKYDFLDQFTKSSLASQIAGIDALRLKIPKVPEYLLKERDFVIARPILPPRPEETKIGKATLATAEQLQEVVRLNSEMVSHVSGLTEMFVKNVFPQWQQKLANDQTAAQEAQRLAEVETARRQKEAQASLNQANKSLRVAVWALVASVVVTIGATGWQLWVAKQYREEDAKAQAANTNGALAEAQLEEMKALRADLAAQKKTTSKSEGASQLRQAEVHQPH
jgi:hypothetical protein